jgi:signal peptidase II
VGGETVEGPSAQGREQRWTRSAPWIAAGVALVVLAADQLSKAWAEASLQPGVRVPLLGDALGIELIYNPGAAFSIGTGFTWIFTLVAAAAVVVGARFAWQVRSRPWAICLGLLLGGATTHLLDRLFRPPGFGRGHVVDFIAYFDWFIGNVADIALFAGAVTLLVVSSLGLTLRPAPAAPVE